MNTKGTVDHASRRLMLVLPVAAAGLYLLGRSNEPQAPAFDVKEILVDEAHALMAAGALVIDVRDKAAYEARHIAGAISAPVSTLVAAIRRRSNMRAASPSNASSSARLARCEK